MKYKWFLIVLIFLAQGCTSLDLTHDEIVTSSPIATERAAEEPTLPAVTATTPAESLQPIPVLYKGVFSSDVEIIDGSTSPGLDFDTNSSTTESGTDFELRVSKGQLFFLTVMPINGASGYYLERDETGIAHIFDYANCLAKVPDFLTGSEPIGPGVSFCWKSNEGRLVEFTILSANGYGDEKISVELEYTVWDKIVE